nr:alginate export family protein [uncultured Flavobacterium sp.]
MKLKSIILLILISLTKFCWSQNFKLMRYDENYSDLKDSAKTFPNNLKFIPLSSANNMYVSLGGEMRGELDYAVNEDWGKMNTGTDVFLLQRYHFHADLHLGHRIRVFGQLRSGLEDGRKNGPRGIDEDTLNVQNLFIDILPYKNLDQSLVIRLGRQEIQYGSGRLIDVREGPNLRLYFDGVKIAYVLDNFSIDAFVMADAIASTGIFDNTSTRKANLWGIYSSYISQKNGNLEFYYLGINRENAVFDQGVADESRHTMGIRFWRNSDGFVYNFEAAYQFGKFGLGNINAFGISSEVGYKFKNIKGLPTAKLKNDYISGDKIKGDGNLGTSNALYPNGGYFGMNPQAGPANLISMHPNITWNPDKNLTLTGEVVFNWRNSLQDGVYAPNGALRLSSANSKKRYIGTAYMTTFSWKINNFFRYSAGIQYFKVGDFIKDIIPKHKDGFFVASVIGCKF